MAMLRLNLLGGFELRSEADSTIAFTLKKAKALLAYLALQPNQAQARDKLAALLWEESSDAQARLSLRQALTALRKALPQADEHIISDSDSITLVQDPARFEVDVLAFERLLANNSPESLHQAVALYQGEFLEGFTPRAASFEDWLMAQRHQLREQALSAFSALLEQARRAGHNDDAIRLAMQLLALDPLRESVQRVLMTLYAKQGRYGAALKQYRLCRTLLQRELGIGPEAETDQLYRDIVQNRRQIDPEPEPVVPLPPVADLTAPASAAVRQSPSEFDRSIVPNRRQTDPTPEPVVSLPPVADLTAPASAAVLQRPSGLVGRRHQCHQFMAALATCRESACGQAFLVRGEAGIGKTRLLEELMVNAKCQGYACHQTAVLDFGTGRGQDVITALVRSLLDLAPIAPIEPLPKPIVSSPERQALLHDLLNLPQPADLKPLYEAMDNSARRLGRQSVVVELITTASQQQALLLVVEDIHWADAETMSTLAHIAAAVNDCPALLAMTSRVEGEPLDPSWRGEMQLAPLTTLDLGPLREGEALVLAQQLGDADTAFQRRCIERAAGNPLFLEQLLQAGDHAEERLPDSVQAIVRGRLQRLVTADKHAAQAASVLGQRFTQSALCSLIDDPDYNAEALIQQRLLRPQDDAFWFTHALIMQGIYSSLTPPQRRQWHGRAAAWFADHDRVLHAEHLEQAEDVQAANAYLSAAQSQYQHMHYDRALDLVRRGLALVQAVNTEYELLCLRGELLHESGLTDASIEAFTRALNVSANEVQQCRAKIGMVTGLRVKDRYAEALDLLNQVETIAQAQGLSHELAQIHYHRGSILFPLGHLDECLQSHQQALDLAVNVAVPALEARALSGLADAYYQRGWMLTAYDHYDRCIQRCQQHGLGRIELANLAMRGLTTFFQNELAISLADNLIVIEKATQVSDHRSACLAHTVLAEVYYYQANYGAALEHGERSLMLARQLGAKRFETEVQYVLGASQAALGDHVEAMHYVEQGYALCREVGAQRYTGPLLLGVLALITSDDEKRHQALSEGEALLSKGCVSHNYLGFYQLAMETTLVNQAWDEAARYADLLENYIRAEPLPWSTFFIDHARALAAHGRGDRDDDLLATLHRLRTDAERVGLRIAIPALDRALMAH